MHVDRRVIGNPKVSMTALLVLVLLLISLVATVTPVGAKGAPGGDGSVQVSPNVHHDVSPPLKDMKPLHESLTTKRDHKKDHELITKVPGGQKDGAHQTTTGPLVSTTAGVGFAGVGNGDYGFTPSSAPPDTNGAVGATQYVQWVNASFAVFNKSTGALVYGPAAGNTIWSGFGGGCQVNNDGDPDVRYDSVSGRWVMAQFSVTSASTYGYLECVAVSKTSDATGSWNRYAFSYGTTSMNDYPKLGVWPDGYYITYNMFANGSTFSGAKVCALNRSAMVSGASATQQCFQLSSNYGGVLPSDLDGSTTPPAGSPNYLLNFGTNTLNLWKFHVDWSNSANSSLSGPTSIAVASFSEACNGGTCISQSGTTQQLDSLADRLMYRLAYRNRGGTESLVVTHSVTSGSSTGIRWYELRSPNGTPSVYQQGTYAPDSNYRWMGSAAMDQAGDIAVGYSVSSGSMHPGIRYTGRTPSDALGTMETETSAKAGGGSQTGNLSRWGDYSAMSVDPSDDCTFWYTTEYLKSSGSFNWSTWITSFKFPNCGSTSTTNDFSMSASPSSLSLAQNTSGTSTISTTTTSGTAQTVNLSVSGLPSGASASLNPTSVTSGSSATLTVNTGTAAAGTYTLTVTGTGSSATHNTTMSLTVTTSGSTAQLIKNGGYESGSTSWSESSSGGYEITSTYKPHAGSYSAWLCGYNNCNDQIWQTVTIPSTMTKATESFWLYVDTNETTSSTCYDHFYARVRTSSGSVIKTPLAQCNLNAHGWTQYTFDLTSALSNYKGKQVQIYFQGTNDVSLPSDFFVDDVRFNVNY